MKRIALALIACAGLGYVAGRVPTQGPQRSEPAPAETLILRSEGQPVETKSWVRENARPIPAPPLVAKLMPKKPEVPADGQLSPGGQWRWSKAQWAWVPVPQPGPRWLQNGHSATVEHLVRDHGMSREAMEKLTEKQRNDIHSSLHNARTVNGVRTVYPPVLDTTSSGCPGGVCPSPSRSRGLFRRR